MSVFNFRIKIFKSWPKSLLGHVIFSGIYDACSDIYNKCWAYTESGDAPWQGKSQVLIVVVI